MSLLGSRRLHYIFLVLALAAVILPAAARGASYVDYYTLAGAPCRVIDTRGTGPAIQAGSPRVVDVAGICGLPDEAVAVSFNVTAIQPTVNGFLTFYPSGVTVPEDPTPPPGIKVPVASLPYFATLNRAKVLLSILGADGMMIANVTAGEVDLVIDVSGYFLGAKAVNDSATVDEDASATSIDVLVNDLNPLGDTLSIASAGATSANGGTVTVAGDNLSLSYTPAADYCNNPPGTTPDTFTYTLSPSNSIGTVSVTVVCKNDAPVLTAGGGGTPTFTEGGSPVVVDGGIGVSDADVNDMIEFATVTIANPLDGASEVLAATACGSLLVTPGSNSLSITGSQPAATYETCLRSVTYENTSSNPDATQRSIEFKVNDGDVDSNTLSRPVNMTSTNNQPTISAIDDQTIAEDTSTGALPFTVGDAETPAASLVVSGSSSDTSIIPNGNIVFGGSGASRTVTVTPAANATGGPVTITITVDDGASQPNSTATETFTLTITGDNDQPTISAIADQTIDEDTSTGALAFTVGDAETAAASLTVSGNSSDTTLIPNANIVFGGSGASRTVTVTPAANVSGGPVTITITVDDGSAQPNSTATETFTVTITAVNDQPTISDVGDQTIDEDTSTGPLAFSVGDQETAAASLTMSGSSSNPAIVPNGNIVFGGSGASRTVTVTPAANASGGPVTITITVDDGSAQPNSTASDTFTVTINAVNDQPTVSAIADQTIDEDTSTGALAFTVGDQETAAASLIVSGSSSNATLVPLSNIAFGGSGASRTVTVTPAANTSGGPVTITVTVDDGSAQPNSTAVETFTVTVNNVNDQPTISAIADQTIDEDTSTSALAFTVGDQETAAASLTVSGSSSNTALIPNGNIVFGGSGPNRTVTVTPAANAFGGPVTITITVDDGSAQPNSTAVETFTITINSVNDQPTITPIADQIIDEDTSTGALTFTIGDVETAAGSLTIGGSSTDTTLIPNGNIVFGGSGANRTVTVTPAPNLFGGPVTITVTVNDGSGAPNATVVEIFTVTVNPVNDAPTAAKDRFEYIGNTELLVDKDPVLTPHARETTASGLGALNNDSDLENNTFFVSAITVGTCTDNSAPFDCTDPLVGTVHMDQTGKFSFEPAPGDTGAAPTADCPGAVDQETFTYTLTDNGTPLPASSAGTVVLCRFARVWYVDPAGGAGNGTSASPFNSLTGTNLADASGDGDLTDDLDTPGDYIFIHEGTLTGSIEMEANQRLLGEGVGLSFPFGLNGNGSTTDLVSAGTKPQLGSGGDTVRITQAMPVEIAGLSLSSTSGNALDLTTTAVLSGSGTLAIRDNEIRSTTAEGIDINLNAGTTGTLVLNITNNSGNLASMPAGNAIDISRLAGTLNLNFSGNTSLVSSTNNAVAIASNALGGINVTGFSGNSVHGNSQAGIAMSQVVFDTNLGTAGFQQVDGDNLAIGDSGNSVLGAGLTLTTVQGNLFFDNLGVYAGTSGLTLSGSGGMTFAVTPNVGIIRAGNGAAVDISSATINLQLDDMDSTTSGAGVSLNAVGGTFSTDTDASISKTSGGGTAFSVANSVSGTAVTYAGSMNVTSGAGVSLSSNSGSTIAFSGGMTLSTGANTGFSATGGGTVTVTDPPGLANNTITTTSGTALNVNGTTIGAANMTFERISAGTSGTPVNGIVLNSTGTLGGLTVTGNGNTALGGNDSGGIIQNTSSDAISLTSTRNVSLTNMRIQNISGGVGAKGIEAVNLAGSNYFRYGTITGLGSGGGADRNGIDIRNTDTNMTLFSIENSVFSNSDSGTSFIFSSARGTSNMRLDVLSNDFSDLVALAVQSNAGDTEDTAHTVTTNIIGNTFRNASPADGQGGVAVAVAEQVATHNFTISNNIFYDLIKGIAGGNSEILLAQTTGGTLNGTISGNTIGNATAGNGDRRGIGVIAEPDVSVNGELGSVDIIIEGNTIDRLPNREAIFVDLREDTQDAALIIRNNNIGQLAGFQGLVGGDLTKVGAQREAIDVQTRGEVSRTLNLLLSGNSVRANTSANVVNLEVNIDNSTPGNLAMHATVTGNSFKNDDPAGAAELIARPRDAGAVTTLCLDMSGNTIDGGAGQIDLNETGVLNVEQASQASLATANGIPSGNVLITGTAPSFGVVCLSPPS